MRFDISIDFKKGPAFSCTVEAQNEKVAKLLAIRDAAYMGMDCSVKRIVARVVDGVAA